MANDVVIVGTAYGCSTTTANRVYGINAITGGIIWNHNGTGTYQYDRFTGLAVDYGRNTVYATTLKTDANHTQNTVIALNTLTGARRWGWDYGGIEAEPVLANGGLFVATRAGILYKLDPDTGATIWQTTIVTSPGLIIQNVVVDAAFNTIYVVDTVGVIHALLDTCTGVVGLWSSSLSGAMVSAPPALFTNPDVPKLYVGSYNGRVYQLNHNTGVTESYATIYGSSTSVDVVAVTRSPGAVIGGYRLIAEAGGTMKYICIPWAADGAQKAIVTVPACYDPNAPTSGLEVGGDLGRKISPTGQGTTRLLSVSKSTCYAFQCASLFGNLPSGLGVSALTSTNATPVWDSSSFVAEATMGLPMTVSLTVTSSIPGTYLTTLILGNAGNVHATVTLTNIVVAPITLSIALNGSQAELTWATNAAGFQLEYTPSLTPPITWQNIASGITTVGTLNHYSVADTATTSNRFYRLRFP